MRHTDYEKENHFFEASHINRREYPAASTVKVYENAEFYVYNYTDRLNIIGMFKVIGIGMSGQGLFITVMDKRTYGTTNVGCKPVRLRGFDFICHVPVRVEIERTVKQVQSGRYIYGISCGLVFRYL